LLEDYVDNLGQLTEADEAEIRADACHFLSLIHNHKSVEYLKKHEFDEDSEVREIVAESLESLKEKGFT
jgi:HEAT repeat protein